MNTGELRKAAMAVYLATESSVAEDLSAKLKGAADEIDKLREWVQRMERQLGAGLKEHRLEIWSDLEGNYSVRRSSKDELTGNDPARETEK
jgi:uncharacterized protein YdhG (YjbR/CyaY superfamily)